MSRVEIGIEKVREILPHGPPFLFVDRVIELEADERIVAERELRPDEPHFTGHFPDRPIMPGVLIAEALAQASGLLVALSAEERGEAAGGRRYHLARADVKWVEPAVPGDVLLLESRLYRTLGDLVAFRVRAYTHRADVALGGLTLARVEG